jgi:hypothetical protein
VHPLASVTLSKTLDVPCDVQVTVGDVAEVALGLALGIVHEYADSPVLVGVNVLVEATVAVGGAYVKVPTGSAFTVTSKEEVMLHPVNVVTRVYVPVAAAVAEGIEGFCEDELNPLGPDQLYVAPATDPAEKLSVLPAQIGLLLATNGAEKSHSKQACFHAEPVYIFKQFEVVLNIINPAGGDAIALRSVTVILGGKKPRVEEETSSIALGSGGVPVALIPT